MHRTQRILGASLLVLTIASIRAEACSCVFTLPQTREAALKGYDLIFVGVVVGARIIGDPRTTYQADVTFQVDRAWTPVQKIVTIRTEDWRVGCGHKFELGEIYLVFAQTRLGVLESNCTPSRSLVEAEKLIEILGEADYVYAR